MRGKGAVCRHRQQWIALVQELKSQQPMLAESVADQLRITGWLDDLSPAIPDEDSEDPFRSPGLTITSFHFDMLVKSLQVCFRC